MAIFKMVDLPAQALMTANPAKTNKIKKIQ